MRALAELDLLRAVFQRSVMMEAGCARGLTLCQKRMIARFDRTTLQFCIGFLSVAET